MQEVTHTLSYLYLSDRLPVSPGPAEVKSSHMVTHLSLSNSSSMSEIVLNAYCHWGTPGYCPF